MKLKQIVKILEAEIITAPNENPDIKVGCGSDLLSDVLIHTEKDSLLLTGLTNIQVVYTASTAGIKAVCFVRGKRPAKDTIDLAQKKGIALMTTALPMFESCGRLHGKGLLGYSEVRKDSVK